jgi:hypothetical protein
MPAQNVNGQDALPRGRGTVRGRLKILTLMAVVGLPVCSADPAPPKPCSEPWYSYIDGLVVTGDGAGHGPDIGSDEWQSVVEFKLEMRGDPRVPDRTSRAWCEFIDELVAKRRK